VLTVANRKAEWIWRRRPSLHSFAALPFSSPDYGQDRNLYVYFRRAVHLADVPTRAIAHVSADGRYQFFVNGIRVGRGPARCDPLWQYYDSYDLAVLLRAGANVVAVLVHSYGRDMSWYQLPRAEWTGAFGCGGFFLQCDIELADGTSTAVHSDESWRYRVADAWQRDVPPGAVGFPEVYDARREPVGWAEPDFDDGDWEAAEVLRRQPINRGPDVRPFPVMVPRDIPFLLEEERLPAAIASRGEAAEPESLDDVAKSVAAETLRPLDRCHVICAEALLSGDAAHAEIRTAPGRNVVLVLDFGRTVSGYPRLVVEGPAGAVLDIAYSERLANGLVEVSPASPVTSQNVHRLTLREGLQTWEQFHWAGFRYLQLIFRSCDQPLKVHKAAVNFTSYPVGRRGSFACSDPLLTRLWEVGADTLRLCMHDGYEDCPSREQRQWVGDAYVEMLVNFAAFGDTRLAAKLLRQVAQSQRPDGMTHMATPGDVAASWTGFIPDYSLYWVMTIGEYALHTGDIALARELFPSVARAMAWFERHLDEHDLLASVPGWVFIDWAEVDRRGECAALNALYSRALGHAARIARWSGAAGEARRYEALAARVRRALNRRLWDRKRGVYVDACVDGRPAGRVSQQTNALLIAYDIAPRERWPRILAAITDEGRLRATSTGPGDPAVRDFDEERQVVLAQPFFMHHVHRALAKAGEHRLLVENVRRRWGAMLEAGATTFWEHWHGRDSQCHAWSATPTYDLSTDVLGVAPLEPGFRRFVVAPKPAGLAWARGVFPSVKGDIAVSWEGRRRSFRLTVGVPPKTTARIVVPPPDEGQWRVVRVNSAVVWRDGALQPNAAGVTEARAEPGGIQLEIERQGRLAIEARRDVRQR
jgi:alpha-L-rhamnosidase